MSALVNAVKERISAKALTSRLDSSVSPTVGVPPRPLARAHQGAPERSDWARRLMELGHLTLPDRENFDDHTDLDSSVSSSWSVASFTIEK